MNMPRNLDSWITALLRNKGLKLLAFILAAVTWFYIQETTRHEDIIRDIPLEVLLPDGWAIQERSVNNVSVTFRGSQADIRGLKADQIRVQVDARDLVDEATIVLSIKRSDVSAPRSVRAMHVDPAEVELRLDREAGKVVPIRMEQLGQPPEGYIVEKVLITPEQVTVYGPQRRLAEVEFVRTVPPGMEGRIRSFTTYSSLMSPGENWQARMDTDRVRLDFTIVEQTVRRDLGNIPVKVLLPPGFARPVAVAPSTVAVSLRGRIDVISNLNERAIHAYIEYVRDDEGSNTEEYPVQINTLPGVMVIAVEPSSVRVKVSGAAP